DGHARGHEGEPEHRGLGEGELLTDGCAPGRAQPRSGASAASRRRQRRQSRSAFGGRDPSETAGSAGRPFRSSAAVRTEGAETAAVSASQAAAGRRSKRAAEARKSAKKITSGGPSRAAACSPGIANETAIRSKNPGCSSTTTLVGPR